VAYNGVIRQCLISSPNDIPETDLLIVHQEITRWNGAYGSTFRTSITPINWNINAAAEYGRPAQDVINDQLVDACDMGIALFATRLGTPTRDSVSGTANEIERLSEAGRPVGVLRSRRPVDLVAVDLEQAQKLEEYLREISTNGLLLDYRDEAGLMARVQDFVRWVVAKDEGITVNELDRTKAADVWPTTEIEDRHHNLILTNHGNAPARNVRVRIEPMNDSDVVWAIIRTWDHDEPDIEILAPNGTVRIPFLRSLAAAPQVRCIVTFTDDRGEQTNTATVRLS
jgi:hypothetical protein